MVNEGTIESIIRDRPYYCTYAWTIDWMIGHFKTLPAGSVIVELGTFIGATTRKLSLALPHVTIHTIDLNDFNNPDHEMLIRTVGNHFNVDNPTADDILAIQDLHLRDLTNVIRHTGLSTSIDVKNIQACFIDAGHTYEETRDDLNHMWNLLVPGGLIFGDDIDSPYVYNAVAEFADMKGLEFTIYSKAFKMVKEEKDGVHFIQRPFLDYAITKEKLYEYYYGSTSDGRV